MGTCSYLEAGEKNLVVKRRNKTCLVTCRCNENTNLVPPLPPAPAPITGGEENTSSAPSQNLVTG